MTDAEISESAPTPHPSDPLSADEISVVVAAVRAGGRLEEQAWFSTITRDDPPGADARTAPRRARLVIIPGPEATVVEAIVDVASGRIERWDERPGMRPALGF